MKQVAIIGVGLMGGSLGLALRRRGLASVSVYARREETRHLALSMGAADSVHDTPAAALKGASLAVFCTPICSMPALAESCAGAFEPGCVVTDVGSTKASLVSAMHEVFKQSGICFVGSHPMAGSEKAGMEAARADLYQGAVTAITPAVDTPHAAIRSVTELWRGVGAKVVTLTPEKHDALVARSSHLPHMIAALLVATAGRESTDEQKAFCGPGFRDSTRIASGSPDVWHDIVKTNRPAILNELREYDLALKGLIQMIEAEDFEGTRTLLEKARRLRNELIG